MAHLHIHTHMATTGKIHRVKHIRVRKLGLSTGNVITVRRVRPPVRRTIYVRYEA